MTFDPVAKDPPADRDHPAALVTVRLTSGGELLNGVVYVPLGPGPHPTVMVLHGLPGYERNLDLAQVYRRAGWTAMVFHYRGAWGSGGTFSFGHVLEDTAVALDHLRSDEMRETCRVDPARIALVGHSMGGWASLLTAAETDVLGAASIAAFNIGALAAAMSQAPDVLDQIKEVFGPQMSPLAGVDLGALFREAAAVGDRWDMRSKASPLAGRPVLLVAATHDSEAPIDFHHRPLAEAFRWAGHPMLTEQMFDTDHAFSDHRVALARSTVEWLDGLLQSTEG